MRSPKDISLLIITAVIGSLFAIMFWRVFGWYGFAIVQILAAISLVYNIYNRKKRR